jgi:hypothetical protein
MRYISWVWFLYVVWGILLGGGAVYLWFTLKEKGIKLVWYEWILFILGVVIYILLGQTFIASFGEGEPQAAWMSLVFLGIPIILIVVGSYRSIKSRVEKPV